MKVGDQGRRFRNVVGRLFLLIGSVLASLIAVEVLLRCDLIPNEYYARTRILGDRKQNGLRVLILGDSFMAPRVGGSIEDYFYAALASYGVRIRNTATPGTGPVQYLENLRREGPRYRPDVVLLSYYIGNDLMDVGCGGDLEDRIDPPQPIAAWKRLYIVQYTSELLRKRFPGRLILKSVAVDPRSSGTAQLLTASLFGAPWPVAEPPKAPDAQGVDYGRMKAAGIPEEYIDAAKKGNLNPWIVSLGAIYPDYFRDELLMRSDCAHRAWKDTKRVLDLILDETANLGADILPVIFPHTFQVDTAHYALYRAWKINVDYEMLRTNRLQQLLDEYFRAHGIEPLDLLQAFRRDGRMLYWNQDEHLNIRGQQVSARLIARAFIARYGTAPRTAGQPRIAPLGHPHVEPPGPTPPALAPMSLPSHIVFADSANRPLMESGWRRADSSGGRSFVWNGGPQSVLWLPVHAHGDIRMDFEVHPFLFPGSPQQRVTVALNGTVIAEVPLRPSLRRYSVILPHATLRDTPNMLEFRYAYTRRPQDVLPNSPDSRVLAVAWFRMDFTAWGH